MRHAINLARREGANYEKGNDFGSGRHDVGYGGSSVFRGNSV